MNQHRLTPPARADLLAHLRSVAGRTHVLVQPRRTRAFAQGYRTGGGPCLAVVKPGSLLELWRVLEICAAADVAILMQAANTGLTGGSTPGPDTANRDIVVISTLRMAGIKLILGGAQVVCLPGATLYQLERRLEPLGREPHSVIGSSCIGASVIGGVCNNSGGALVRRGPAYTEMALFARRRGDGKLELVNHLGLELGDTPEAMLRALDNATSLDDLLCASRGCASDHDYAHHVRDIDADTPARFNADPRRLHEASGCAGKVAVFAVRLDTFPKERQTKTFYLGTNSPAALTSLRRHVLAHAQTLPIAAEYLHREAFRIAARYGKDAYLAINLLGAERLPLIYRFKRGLDAFSRLMPGFPASFGDRVLQTIASILPAHLPPRLSAFAEKFEHHLILQVAGDEIANTRAHLESAWNVDTGDFIECTETESRAALLHRFVMAGAAIRYQAIHERETDALLALDVALKRNDLDWVEQLPPVLEAVIAAKLYYGHFFCHVFHRDYLVRKHADVSALKDSLCALLDARGAEYPAEHNVGRLYAAKPALERHYRELDPSNTFNPGVGLLSTASHWT